MVDPAEHRGHREATATVNPPPGCPRIQARPSPNTGSTSEYRRDHPLIRRRRPTEYRLDHPVTNEGNDGPSAEYGRDHPVSLPLIPCNRSPSRVDNADARPRRATEFLGENVRGAIAEPPGSTTPAGRTGRPASATRPSAEPPVPPGPSPGSAGRRPLRATRPKSPTEDGRSGPSPSSTRTPPLRPTAEPARGAGSPASLARTPSQAGPGDRGAARAASSNGQPRRTGSGQL